MIAHQLYTHPNLPADFVLVSSDGLVRAWSGGSSLAQARALAREWWRTREATATRVDAAAERLLLRNVGLEPGQPERFLSLTQAAQEVGMLPTVLSKSLRSNPLPGLLRDARDRVVGIPASALPELRNRVGRRGRPRAFRLK